MSKVLMDVFSVLVLQGALSRSGEGRPLLDLTGPSNVIENVVLCDKILLESSQSHEWDVTSVTNRFPEVFELIEVGDAYELSDTYGLDKFAFKEPRTLWTYVRDLSRSRRDRSSELSKAYREIPREHKSYYAGSMYGFLKRADHYLALARKMGVYLSLHPTRAEYLRSVLSKKQRLTASQVAISYFDKRLSSVEAAEYAGVDLSVPPVVDYVTAFAAKNHLDLLTAANEVRLSKNAVRFRERCMRIDEELADFCGRPSVLSLQKLIGDIDRVASKWESDLDEGVKYVRREVSLRKVWGLGSLLESLGIEKLTMKDPIIFSKDGDLLFLNDLYRSPMFGSSTEP